MREMGPRLRGIQPVVLLAGVLVGGAIGAAIAGGWIPVGVGVALAALAGIAVGIVSAAARGRKGGSS